VRLVQGLVQAQMPQRVLHGVELRYFSAAAVGYPIAACLHLSVAAFYALHHLELLAGWNALAAGVWVGMSYLLKAGRTRLSFDLGLLEAGINAALTVWSAGWALGFQNFLLVATVFCFFVPATRRRQVTMAALLMVEYCGLLVLARLVAPQHVLPEPAGTLVALTYALGGFVITSLGAFAYGAAVDSAEAAMEVAHARSEGLLRDVLPEPIVERLKVTRGTIADSFPEASVLFADLVGFTGLSQQLSPSDLVGLLNALFSRFDELTAARGLEKIKTIGDAYMVASGIPVPRADHAEALAGLALELRDAVVHFNLERGTALEVRVGLHSGPVVAGVIGKLRFLYDLWGDTVNTASRMESHGQAGEIHLSQQTAARLESRGFVLEPRGVIEVKGKGAMTTFWLRGRAAR
jgi:class 3 adenylate cyclase